MLFNQVFSFLILTITLTKSYTFAENSPKKNDVSETAMEKRIMKRDASIIIDNFPVEPIYRSHSNPNVIYRRISHRSPPKYGPPKSKYRSVKPRKPAKKYRKPLNTKYGHPSRRKRPSKFRYGPPKSSYKSIYGPPKKAPQFSYYASEPQEFGEPPSEFMSDIQTYSNFGEPPEIYSEPLESAISKPYPPSQSYSDIATSYNTPDINYNDDYQESLNAYLSKNSDTKYAFSKKRPIYVKPESYFETTPESDPTVNDEYKYREIVKNHKLFVPTYEGKKRTLVGNKNTKRPIKMQSPDAEDEVLVGGQYAEPPVRFVPKLQSMAPMHRDEDDYSQTKYFIDPDAVSSSSISSYVNYKNSNLAFSPQNLNDAFSIVET